MADVLLHPDVEEQLRTLPDHVETRIREKLADAGTNPSHFLKPLSGRPEYRLRIGDYRAIVDWDKQADELRVLEVAKAGFRLRLIRTAVPIYRSDRTTACGRCGTDLQRSV